MSGDHGYIGHFFHHLLVPSGLVWAQSHIWYSHWKVKCSYSYPTLQLGGSITVDEGQLKSHGNLVVNGQTFHLY
jgi:hypothetical protein